MQHSDKLETGRPGKAGKPVDPLRREIAERDAVKGQAMPVVATDRVTSVTAIPLEKVDLKEEILRTALSKLSSTAALKVILTEIEPDEMGALLAKALVEGGQLRGLLKAMHEANEPAMEEALIATKIMPPREESLDHVMEVARLRHDGDALVGKLELDRLPNSVIAGMVERLLEQYPAHQKLQLAHALLKAS